LSASSRRRKRHPPEPPACILHHAQRIFLLIHWEDFMSRPEVDDAPLPDLPNMAGAEMLAVVPALLEYRFVRLWNMKRLIVHFRLLNLPLLRQPLRQRMIGLQRRHMTRLPIRAKRREDAA